jgi:type VI secretion system protein ImpM
VNSIAHQASSARLRCGLFGKLPAKRDFVAINAPANFLKAWEAWIQACISASRQSLGQEWQPAFLKAPIWRFWLGEEICGNAVIGAFMPSLDGIGRYFPLTTFVCAHDRSSIPPPELEPQEAWFSAVESFLLSTLEEGCSYEASIAALQALPGPSALDPSRPSSGLIEAGEGLVGRFGTERDLKDTFTEMRLRDYGRSYSAMSFWWTVGGLDYQPFAIAERGMPNAFLFSEMLTGRFAFGFE